MAKPTASSIPSPKGTRDLYPEELLRQRYITEAWRRVSIRHGFEEIAGPTFEMLDLYKKKSGEGIVSELFSFRRSGGDDDYALRPEFTPTLARMFAAKAASLPSPCKWFTAGPYFRAEKPQRGRLREFLQWNCDVMGEISTRADADLIEVLLALAIDVGLSSDYIKLLISSRNLIEIVAINSGISPDNYNVFLTFLDNIRKMRGINSTWVSDRLSGYQLSSQQFDAISKLLYTIDKEPSSKILTTLDIEQNRSYTIEVKQVIQLLKDSGIADQSWLSLDLTIARGLAYYTGTVFELIADGERAVAGGGRYDNLIELFGGPPTPAVGFGMGDVVLGLLLEDKGLMPEGPALMDALSQKPASLRPEAYVIASEQGEAQVEPLLARLRRGVESAAWTERGGKPWDADRYEVPPMHARRSYKSTKNIGKLIGEARKQHAKFAVIIESDESAKVENLETREDLGTMGLEKVGAAIAGRI